MRLFSWLRKPAPATPRLEAQAFAPLPRRCAACCAAADFDRGLLWLWGGPGQRTLWMTSLDRPRWQEVRQESDRRPPGDLGAMLCLPEQPALVHFGGWRHEADGPQDFPSAEFWAFEFTGPATGCWHELLPAGTAPPGRNGAALSFDPAGRQLWLFGGDHGRQGDGAPGFSPLGDLWAYQLQDRHWRRVIGQSARPSARFLHGQCLDSQSRALYVWGGRVAGAPDATVHRYDIERNRWEGLSARGKARPMPREGHALCFSSSPHGLLLLGGREIDPQHPGAAAPCAQSWFFDLECSMWLALELAESPQLAARCVFGHAACWDAEGATIYLLGGETAGAAPTSEPTWSDDVSCMRLLR